MEISYEKSVEAAIPIRKINDAILELDIDYLKEALKHMKESHSFRESAMILSPNPFLSMAKGDLESAKLKQLELMIQLAENSHKIIEKEGEYIKTKNSSDKLNDLFGF